MLRQPAQFVAFLVAALLVLTAGAVAQGSRQLGPVDGFELPPTDIDRVSVGTVAPDFSLSAMNGDMITLSDFRGRENVVLVFYRGHW
jgi:cytochrome oxidase Cu insertion factor (SCO1/SenC/PrrC family)